MTDLLATTPVLLTSTPDSELPLLLCNYVHACLFVDCPKDPDGALARLLEGLRYVWYIAGIDFEVPNGGFNQFFYNTTGQYALETVEALRAIGAREPADILEQAVRLFEKEVGRPATSRERWFGDPCPQGVLDPLERRFCAG